MMLYISAAATTNKVLNIFENRFFFVEYFQYWDPSSQACNAKHKKRDQS